MNNNLLVEEISRIFEIMGNKEGVKIFESNLLTEQEGRLRLLSIFKNNIERYLEQTGDDFEKSFEKIHGKGFSKNLTTFKDRLGSWLDEMLSKSVLTDAEKKLIGEFLVLSVKSSPEFRKNYVEAQFNKWFSKEKTLGKYKVENIIGGTFGDDALNEYKRLRDLKSLEKNYAHIDPLKPKVEAKPITKSHGVTLSPQTESKVESNLKNSNYNNHSLAENFFKGLYKSGYGGDKSKVKSKIINFFKEVFNSKELSDKFRHWSEIFDESQMKQINTMLDILNKKFEGSNITYGDGKNWLTVDNFRKNVLDKDKLLVDNSDGILKFSPLNKLDTNFNDNSRILMDWISILSDEELTRFKVLTNMFSKGEIGYSEYEKELDYVLNELKKDTKYPLSWFSNTKDRSASWFTENISKNTEKGNKSEEIIDKVLFDNGLKSEINLQNVGNIKLTSLEGSPVDRLLNIDMIVQDTEGIFGKPGDFLTVQVKSAQEIKFDPKLNGYKFYGGANIAKPTMVDIAAYVANNGYIILEKENGKFTQKIDESGKTFTFVPSNQVKITNIK